MQLCHWHIAHASNAWIIEVLKLVDGIKLLDAVTNNSNNHQFFSDSEIDDKKGSEPDIDIYITRLHSTKL